MINCLSEIFKKHKVWVDIVCTFGCNKETAEDIVQEMYINIDKKIKKGLDINFGENDNNYYYIFKTLKTIFLKLKHKKTKCNIIDIETYTKYLSYFGNRNYDLIYKNIKNELNQMYRYDKKVFEIIKAGDSVAKLSMKS